MRPIKTIKGWWKRRKALKRINAEQPAVLLFYHPMFGDGEIRYRSLEHLKNALSATYFHLFAKPQAAICGDKIYNNKQLRKWAMQRHKQECSQLFNEPEAVEWDVNLYQTGGDNE